MWKKRVTNGSAEAIIYRAANPQELFIEMKDSGHPIALVRGQLCFIGGNWIGEAAKADGGPRDTFYRELDQELTFDRPIRDSVELEQMGIAERAAFAPTLISNVEVTEQDQQALRRIKEQIEYCSRPYGTFVNYVTKKALDLADSSNKRKGFTTVACCFVAGLDEETWQALLRLQTVFNNLSSDAVTLITTLDQIISSGTKIAFGHDRVLQLFLRDLGLPQAESLPLVADVGVYRWGEVLATWAEYLDDFDIAKRP